MDVDGCSYLSFQSFKSKPDNFAAFFRHVLQTGLQDDDDISYKERTALIAFLIHCFNSLVCYRQERSCLSHIDDEI